MKLGLVLEGGASRTYFSCGVLDVLLEENIIADYVIGTSAGIANAVSYASMQKGRNLQIAQQYLHDKRYMGIRHLFNPKNRSLYNIKFVFDDIPNKYIPFDYDAFSKFEGDVVSVVTNIETGKAEYLKMPREDKQFNYLVASCALPIIFPIIKINGKKYMDGGITNPIAVNQAISEGCNKNIVILTRERGYIKTYEKGLGIASRFYRKYPEFRKALEKRTETYNNNMNELNILEQENKVFIIAPKEINCGRTETRPDIISGIYNHGCEVMRELMPSLKQYLSL